MLASKVKFEATYIPSLCITWSLLYMTLHALVLFILTWALILVHRCQSENLAATTVLLDSLAPEGNTSLSALCASSWWLSLHTCLDLTGHGEEGLLHIGGSLGRCFEKFNAKRIRKFLSLFGRNNTLGGQVGLVTNQKLVNIFTGISINFVQPLLYIVEGFIVGNIVNNDNAVGTTVIRRCDCTETFLTSGIPDLKLDGLSI